MIRKNRIIQTPPLCKLSTTNTMEQLILVMDDEETILSIATSMLKHLGYSTATCTNGDEAIEIYRTAKESGKPFFAVLMDLTIPCGIGGKDAAQQILLIDPHARLIVSSGYSDDPVMADYKRCGFLLSLPKPYRLSDLAKALAALHSL